MHKWNLPLTYAPKIDPVRNGECRQTIRVLNKTKAHPEGYRKSKGDLIRFFAWTGRPYHSKREWVISEYQELTEVITIFIGNKTIGFIESNSGYLWNSPFANELARRDGIVPPTGEALREVLINKNGKIPAEGLEAQVLRW